MKKKSGAGCGGGAGGCLGAPMRALSRACDSACDLYVRGMSGCARSVPSGSSAAGVVGRGFAGTGAASLRLRVSSESADDLVRDAVRRHQRRVAAGDGAAKTKGVGAGAAARQGRVAPEPAEHAVGQYGAAAGKKGGAGAALVSAAAAPSVWGPARLRTQTTVANSPDPLLSSLAWLQPAVGSRVAHHLYPHPKDGLQLFPPPSVPFGPAPRRSFSSW